MTPTIDHAATIDLAGPLFANRLASLLRTSRRVSGVGLPLVARASNGVFTERRLEAIEAGLADLEDVDLVLLGELYAVDVSAVLLDRVGLLVDLAAGRLQIAGRTRSFLSGHPEAMLIAYLALVRDLRNLARQGHIELRRHDLKVLAGTLRTDIPSVLGRLGELMDLSEERRSSLLAGYAAGAPAITAAP